VTKEFNIIYNQEYGISVGLKLIYKILGEKIQTQIQVEEESTQRRN